MENVANYAELGKYIGAGLACFGMAGAAMAVGNVAGNYLSGALRNPSAAASQTATLFIGMAFAAGVKTMLRTAAEMGQAPPAGTARDSMPDDDPDDDERD